MNYKALSLVCAVSLSAALIAGCGQNEADGGAATGANNTRGYTALQSRNHAADHDAAGRTDGRGNGQSTAHTAQGKKGSSEKMGILSAIQDNDVLVLDDTVIISGDQAVDANQYGPDVIILRVSNQEALQAIKRVKEKLGGNKANQDMKGIASDLKLILQHAAPVSDGGK